MSTVTLDNKTILVTGAAGFIGSNLVKRIYQEAPSATVIGIDNMNAYYDVALKEFRLNELAKYPTFTFVKGNIADKELITELFEKYKPSVVVNLAAQAGVRYSITNPDAYVESNLVGFFNILEACRHCESLEHLVYASSSSVYGSNKKVPYSTDDKVDNPVSLYAATKKSNELIDPSDAGSGHRPLAGAGFILYADEAMNTPVSMVKVDATATTDAYYRPALAGEAGAVAQMDANMGNDNNNLSIRGLDVGSYYVKETKTPSGYYAPKGSFKLELTAERDASESLVKTLAKGGFSALEKADRALVQRDGVNKGLNRFEADLLNSSTPVLPTTGGVGTVMFTVIGLLCMGAALWFFLFARRRREDEQEQNKTTL